MTLNRLIKRAFLATTLPLLTACIGGSSPPSQFYMLEPIRGAESGPSAAERSRVVLALAPVRIPQYVDRPQIVTATATNAYQLSEFNRWAERLDDNISRVLAQNLGTLVPADVVPANASNLAKQAAVRVNVSFLEFHVDPQGQARTVADWRISQGENTVVSRRSSYREPASTTDYRVIAGALNACLNRLSREIADSVRTVVRAR